MVTCHFSIDPKENKCAKYIDNPNYRFVASEGTSFGNRKYCVNKSNVSSSDQITTSFGIYLPYIASVLIILILGGIIIHVKKHKS